MSGHYSDEDHLPAEVDFSEGKRGLHHIPHHSARQAEMAWLEAHSGEYRGQWVALEGPELISHGPDAHAVRAEARRKGIQHPLMVCIAEDFDLPSAGMLQL